MTLTGQALLIAATMPDKSVLAIKKKVPAPGENAGTSSRMRGQTKERKKSLGTRGGVPCGSTLSFRLSIRPIHWPC